MFKFLKKQLNIIAEKKLNPLQITHKCANRIKFINQKNNQNNKLRIFVENGGCNGFKASFSFDEKINENDM
jgi:Fe-S cluster assembly iron-binding protein IscA